jgi:capsular exopolysaccharide synthesis family protein
MDKIEDLLNSMELESKTNRTNIFLKYIDNWYWFAVFCGAGLIAGFILFTTSPQAYRVQSRLLIPTEENALSSMIPFNTSVLPKYQKIENQIGILQSFSLYKKALENLKWESAFYKKDGLNMLELYEDKPFELKVPVNARNLAGVKLEIMPVNDLEYEVSVDDKIVRDGIKQPLKFTQKANFNSAFKTPNFEFTLNRKDCVNGQIYYLVFHDINSLTQQYLKDVKISLEDKKSELINLQLVGPNPKKSADFINELNQVFISYGVKKKNQTSENSINFIDTTLIGISNSLKNAELNLSNYRKDNKVLDLGSESKVIYEKLEEIENEKYLAKMRIEYYKNLQTYIGDAKKIKQMITPSIIGITDAGLNGLLPKLMDLYSKREVLSYSVEENNPSLILLDKEIQLTSNALSETLNNLLKNAEIEMQSMEVRYASIQERLSKLPDTERKLISIQRDFNLNNELYTYLLQKKAEASISLASNIPQVQIIDPAMVEAAQHIGPNLYKDLMGGFGLGFLFPFMFILITELFNTKIESVEEIEKLTKLQILDGIIHSKYKDSLPVIKNPNSGIAESFRLLKANLRILLESPEKKIISFNSLVSGEGKSFISSNFAIILSLSVTGKKVLLIEGDMRKPKLGKLFTESNANGLSTYLQGKKEFNEIVYETSTPNLYFAPAGEIPPNPTEILESNRFKQFMEEAKSQFDYIILDNAPIALVPDGLLTSQFVDLNIFVLRLNYSRKKEIKDINRAVSVNDIKNAIIVVNDSNKKQYGYGNKYWKNGYGNYVKMNRIA